MEYASLLTNKKAPKAANIRVFDPKYSDSISIGLVASVGKYIIYRDVYIFVDRLKDVVNTKLYTYATIKNSISLYL